MAGSSNRCPNSPSFDRRKSIVIPDSDEDIEVILICTSDTSANISIDITPKKRKKKFDHDIGFSSLIPKLPLSKKSSISDGAIKCRIKSRISEYSDGATNSNDNELEIVSLDSSKSDSALNGETEENPVENRKRGEEINQSSRIAQNNINHIEDRAYISSSDNESNSHIEDRIDVASTSTHASTGRTEDEQCTRPIDFNVGRSSSSELKLAMSLAKQEAGIGSVDPIVAQKRTLLAYKKEQLQNELSKSKDKSDKLRKSIAVQEKELKDVTAELERRPSSDFDNVLHASPNIKAFGKKELKELRALIRDKLEDLDRSLADKPSEDVKADKPSEDVKAESPQGLRVKLVCHQQHALAWLLWREEGNPAGGILADGTGLGKTITMISLIVATIMKKKSESRMRYKGGTLVVCPAYLLPKWKNEINNRCKPKILSVLVYHGKTRLAIAKEMTKYDVVITTYETLVMECKETSIVYKIHWERVTLDKAERIFEFQSQTSAAVCDLIAHKRWAVTGTPIQNNEMNVYALLKFLRFSPFNDLKVWLRWVYNRTREGSQQRFKILTTALVLRRTKQELQSKGEVEDFPEKCVKEVTVTLDSEEKSVYEKGFIYARGVVTRFLEQTQKLQMLDKNTQFTKAQEMLQSSYCDVKAREISVLLLRLRQICDHASLILSKLDEEFTKETQIKESENLDRNLLSRISNIRTTNEQNIGVYRRRVAFSNPVFRSDRISSKVKRVLDTVNEILRKKDKIIIVSLWTSMLEIVAAHLLSIKGATSKMFTWDVPMKERQDIIDLFNAANDSSRILLLPLSAVGVDLNLVGGNHLLLLDNHWNPQFEVQTQDLIYRLGQTKNIFIYKFICKDTIEERIQNLQEKKLELAQDVRIGYKKSGATELILNDLKSLFAL